MSIASSGLEDFTYANSLPPSFHLLSFPLLRRLSTAEVLLYGSTSIGLPSSLEANGDERTDERLPVLPPASKMGNFLLGANP